MTAGETLPWLYTPVFFFFCLDEGKLEGGGVEVERGATTCFGNRSFLEADGAGDKPYSKSSIPRTRLLGKQNACANVNDILTLRTSLLREQNACATAEQWRVWKTIFIKCLRWKIASQLVFHSFSWDFLIVKTFGLSVKFFLI